MVAGSISRTETILDRILSGAENGTCYSGLLTNELQTNEQPCLIGAFSDENNEVLFYLPFGEGFEWVCDGSSVTKFYSVVTNTYKSYY